MLPTYKTLVEGCKMGEGMSVNSIDEVRKTLGKPLPNSYVEFLKEMNGVEGFIGSTVYLVLWPADKLAAYNEMYGVCEFAPDLVLIGSDGGNTGYAIDTRVSGGEFAEVPLVGMSHDDTTKISNTMSDFLASLRAKAQ